MVLSEEDDRGMISRSIVIDNCTWKYNNMIIVSNIKQWNIKGHAWFFFFFLVFSKLLNSVSKWCMHGFVYPDIFAGEPKGGSFKTFAFGALKNFYYSYPFIYFYFFLISYMELLIQFHRKCTVVVVVVVFFSFFGGGGGGNVRCKISADRSQVAATDKR